MAARVALEPFPAEHLLELWEWMNQFPKANFDDAGPQSLEQFLQVMMHRAANGYKLVGVRLDSQWVGAIGFDQGDGRRGYLRGVCFDKAVHGTGIARLALGTLLVALWQEGYRKIGAAYFAGNPRIRKFLLALGAKDEGYLHEESMREGKPVDVRLVAFFPSPGGGIAAAEGSVN